MGQHKNKTEQDFSDKLNQRKIMPSANAWDRLDAMLAVAEEKKSKRGYGWLYIAASFLGFLLIGTVFFSQTEEVVDKAREHVVFENQAEKPKNSQEIVPASGSGTIASTENPIRIKNNQNHNHQSKSNQSQSSNQNQSTSTINQNPVEAVNQVPDNQKLIASTNPIINQKTEHPVSVKVDELLAAAQSNNPKSSVKVNAKNLLSEVDQQVNLTFREKMLRRAGEVAETVANRNNE